MVMFIRRGDTVVFSGIEGEGVIDWKCGSVEEKNKT